MPTAGPSRECRSDGAVTGASVRAHSAVRPRQRQSVAPHTTFWPWSQGRGALLSADTSCDARISRESPAQAHADSGATSRHRRGTGPHTIPAESTAPRPPAVGQNRARERRPPRRRTSSRGSQRSRPEPSLPRTGRADDGLRRPSRGPREPSGPAPRRPIRGRTRPPRAPAAPAMSR